MQYIEPRKVTLVVNGQPISGMIEGSNDSVIFSSQENTFLKHFPDGRFDSLNIRRNSSQQQKDILEAARNHIQSLLGK